MNTDGPTGGAPLSPLSFGKVGKKGTWKPVVVVVVVVVVLLLLLVVLLMALSRRPGGGPGGLELPGLTQEETASEVTPQTEYQNPFDRSTQYVNPFEENKSPFNSLQQ